MQQEKKGNTCSQFSKCYFREKQTHSFLHVKVKKLNIINVNLANLLSLPLSDTDISHTPSFFEFFLAAAVYSHIASPYYVAAASLFFNLCCHNLLMKQYLFPYSFFHNYLMTWSNHILNLLPLLMSLRNFLTYDMLETLVGLICSWANPRTSLSFWVGL